MKLEKKSYKLKKKEYRDGINIGYTMPTRQPVSKTNLCRQIYEDLCWGRLTPLYGTFS